ncbi:cyclic nucleotide-binding domain-containing protein [Catalinimonas sp. 4WD22]|uniref:Crp/Fnr family transcriptional regulator n=1 Tax=Catalinimonas locisalis TaxID=3133978 RepID=UPI0031019684
MQRYINELMRAFLSGQHSLSFYKKFAQYVHLRVFSKNEIIFKEGDEAKTVCLLCKGEVLLIKRKDSQQFGLMETLKKNEILGFASVVSHTNHNTSAIAKSKVYILEILKDELQQFLNDYPKYHFALAQSLSKKILHYESMIVS